MVAAEQCFADVVPKAAMDLDARQLATHEGPFNDKINPDKEMEGLLDYFVSV